MNMPRPVLVAPLIVSADAVGQLQQEQGEMNNAHQVKRCDRGPDLH
eukprot:CAMPEP_0178984492 /NCGR_PEP_ID=MMETSP0795-20121207/1633_1 /TAXON_ID=88552 /ORGANISM="Amoebophrya sp., Strain Ameob2" /LENGTH=45 /DNA_ID= /DNA_START= /DNA_END= /DNA_ORIENTATION=